MLYFVLSEGQLPLLHQFFIDVLGSQGSTFRVGFLFPFKKNTNLVILKFCDYWVTVEISENMKK